MFMHRQLFIGIHTSHYTLMITREHRTLIAVLVYVGTQSDVTVTVCGKRREEEPFPTGSHVNIRRVTIWRGQMEVNTLGS